MGSKGIQIYVACLASYNAGKLHGRWIDATLGEDHIEEEIQAMLVKSPVLDAEEYAIHDTEGFHGLGVGGVSDAAFLGAWLEDTGEAGARFYEELQARGEAGGLSVRGLKGKWDARLVGEFKNEGDFAWEELESSGDLPAKHLQPFFNFKEYGEEVLGSGEYFHFRTSDRRLHVFHMDD